MKKLIFLGLVALTPVVLMNVGPLDLSNSRNLSSVPRSSDVAVYQDLHEIKVSKTKYLNFDSDINKLSAQEKRHRRNLPLHISAPMKRLEQTPYKPSRK